MATPLYSLIFFRTDGTVLTGFGSTSDLFNVDHLNHVTHTAAPYLNSWEEDIPQMQETAAPFPSGGLSLPVTLADEIKRLRFQIARIKQQIAGGATAPFWYTATADYTNSISLAPAAARLEQTVAQDIPGTGVFTQVTFDTATYDTVPMRSGSTLVAPGDGVYIIGGTLAFGDGVTQGPQFLAQILLQSITTLSATSNLALQGYYSDGAGSKAMTVECAVRLTTGTTVRLMAAQNDGTPKPAIIDTDAKPAMWMALVGRG